MNCPVATFILAVTFVWVVRVCATPKTGEADQLLESHRVLLLCTAPKPGKAEHKTYCSLASSPSPSVSASANTDRHLA